MDFIRINIEATEIYPALVVTTEDIGDEWFDKEEAISIPIELINVLKEGNRVVNAANQAILEYIVANTDTDSDVHETAVFLIKNKVY